MVHDCLGSTTGHSGTNMFNPFKTKKEKYDSLHIMTKLVRAMVLCTCAAHYRIKDANIVMKEIDMLIADFITEYTFSHPNPDFQEVLKEIVLETRNLTEMLLGVDK